MYLSASFADRMVRIHGEAGREWAIRLPETLRRLERRWQVTIEAPYPRLTYNFAAPATGWDGRRWVVKVGVKAWEGDREPLAMAAYGGRGAARLARHDPEFNAMLLERIEPGTNLRDVPDPQAVGIAADVLRELWAAPVPEGLADLETWTASLDRFRAEPGPLPPDLLDRAFARRRELLVDPPERVVVHGDLHPMNLLWSETRGWLAIDPKGLVGEKAFDIPFCLLNPGPVPKETTRLRIDTFVDRLRLDRERVVGWAFVQAAVSACWTVEDGETGWERAIRFAEDLGS